MYFKTLLLLTCLVQIWAHPAGGPGEEPAQIAPVGEDAPVAPQEAEPVPEPSPVAPEADVPAPTDSALQPGTKVLAAPVATAKKSKAKARKTLPSYNVFFPISIGGGARYTRNSAGAGQPTSIANSFSTGDDSIAGSSAVAFGEADLDLIRQYFGMGQQQDNID